MQVTVFYDDYCPLCKKSKVFLEKIDITHQLFFDGVRGSHIKEKYPDLDLVKSIERMATFYQNKYRFGFNSIFLIVRRLPLLWIFIPLFIILKLSKLGDIFYNYIASSRGILPYSCDEHCNIN
jgi:predicted DCC family thiol-disulfide oxidoreductase YuxK